MKRPGKYVVLKVIDGEEGYMATYSPQLATVFEYDSEEAAAVSNVGSHPDARERGKPYRTVVIPWEHWHEFEVFSNRLYGCDVFEALPTADDHLTIRTSRSA